MAILKWPIPFADSRELAIFLENQPFLSTLCTLKIRGIGHNPKELARFQVEIGKRNRQLQNSTFSRLSSVM